MRSRPTLVFAIIAIVIVETVIADDESCDLKENEDCMTGFLRYFLSQFTNFHTAQEELESTCEDFKKNATCATSQPKLCKDRYPMLSDLLKSIDKYSNRFCRNSEEQKLYLEQAPCLRQHNESFQKCVENLDGCQNLNKTIVCIKETGTNCGKPAEELMDYLMEPLDVYPIFRSSQTRPWMNVFRCIYPYVDDSRAEIDDSAIVCIFESIRKCYELIGNLGADLTVELPETILDLRRTCSGNKSKIFSRCLKNVEWHCNANIGDAINLQNMIMDFCDDGAALVYRKAFMNSAECYNSYLPGIRQCYFEHATQKTDDAKALCCSAYKTKQCTNFLTNLCSKNVTLVPGRAYTDVLPAANLVHKYYGYADRICEKDFYKQC